MSAPELTPEKLTWTSFKHSQGVNSIQARILRYVLIDADIEPDLNPTPEVRNRYARFLLANRGLHINPLEGTVITSDTFKYIDAAFTNLAEAYQEVNRSGDSEDLLVYDIAGSLLDREKSILDLDNPWSSYDKHTGVEKRAQRIEARVKKGQASFLYYYGRDGKSAEHPVYDKLYADIWQVIEAAIANSPEAYTLHETATEHAVLVGRAVEAFDLTAA